MSDSINTRQRDLIVFGEDWGSLPSSTQYIISQLATHRKVLWINSIGLRQPHLSIKDTKRAMLKLGKFIGKNITTTFNYSDSKEQEKPRELRNITFLNPIAIPAPKSKVMRKISAKMLHNQITPILSKLNLNKPILWASLPTAVDMIDSLEIDKVVYYCGDDFSALAGVDHNTVVMREHELVRRSDLIISASETLSCRFPRSKSYCVEHGVDYDLFTKQSLRAEDLPPVGALVAGFYGSINEWFDLALLCAVATKMKHWHFVLIGKVDIDVSSVRHLNNVHFLGAKSHQDLPRYSQHWSISMMPFVLNDQITACNPLKLTEYLAAGQPIVATKFPASEQYQAIIDLVDDATQMIDVLYKHEGLSKRNNMVNSQNLLRKAVVNKSWTHQSNRVSSLLDAL